MLNSSQIQKKTVKEKKTAVVTTKESRLAAEKPTAHSMENTTLEFPFGRYLRYRV